MWSMRKQLHVAALLALSVGLFYLAFTIDRVDGKMFEHSSVVKLDANNFDEKVGHGLQILVFMLSTCLSSFNGLAHAESGFAKKLKTSMPGDDRSTMARCTSSNSMHPGVGTARSSLPPGASWQTSSSTTRTSALGRWTVHKHRTCARSWRSQATQP